MALQDLGHRLTGRVADGVVAVTAAGLDALLFTSGPTELADVDWIVFETPLALQAVAVMAAAPILYLRRRAALTVCLVLSLYAALLTVLLGARPLVILLVALYTAASRSATAPAVAALAAVFVAHGCTVAAETTAVPVADRGYVALAMTLVFGLLDLSAWGVGRWSAAARSRERRLEATRRLLAAEAVAAERLRIARELHDIVAHSVTIMLLQAAGARRVVFTEPAVAGAAMASVETAGKQAMAEMRRMLDVLRSVRPDQDDAPGGAGSAPTPGLSDLDELVRKVEVAGVTVAVETYGSAGVLDPSVNLTAYRLLQEALTNVTRHGGAGSSVMVRLRWEPDTLDIEVVDDGAGSPERVAQDGSGGLGLVGLRERVKLIGGHLSAGPAPGAGYRVVARLPASAPALGAEAQV